MNKKDQPLVSIGIPVYNGENYIREAIDSILNQTYDNIEIIISDNASTDSTQKICESYVQSDARIKYKRFEENQGAAKNFNNTFDLANGKYFKWASHDDHMESTYIEKCVDYLEQHPDVHLCHTRKNIIDKDSNVITRLDFTGLELDENHPNQRFKSFLRAFRYFQDDADVVFGVFRSRILANTQKIANYHSSDFTLTAEIVLQGKIHIVEEYLFNRRFHQNMSTVAHHSKASRARWFDTKSNGSLISNFPYLLWFSEFIKFIGRSKFKLGKKINMSMATVDWLIARIYLRIAIRLKFKRPTDFGKVFIDIR